jgi:soluble lytic murein transglycosylase-like protein
MKAVALLLFAMASGPVALGKGPPALREYAVRCVRYYAHVYRVPVELVEAVIDVESDWNPYAVSPKGAVGLMQLMPATAVGFRVRNRFWVRDNIRGGVAYLAWLIHLFRGDLRLVMAAYVAGENQVAPRGLEYSSRQVYEYVSRVARRYERRRLMSKTGGKL